MTLNWEKLVSQKRRKQLGEDGSKSKNTAGAIEERTESERDFDRILFSTPVRRLADKTQVFPLKRKDSVRTRLTHSLEVSNIARSIGTNLVFNHEDKFPETINPKRNIPSMLAAIGLAHDLGNPPFGHQGEEAIQTWFLKNEEEVLGKGEQFSLSDGMKNDFLKFEGNAQTLRLLTRLQILDDEYGLDLTIGTLASLMKYTVASNETNKNESVIKKKHGFFQSEKNIVENIFEITGLDYGKRHPLTYIMESADDIAYSVLDVEDAVKKGLLSFYDITSHLKRIAGGNQLINDICQNAEKKHDDYSEKNLSPSELNEIATQRLRVFAISSMVTEVTNAFVNNYEEILEGDFKKSLIEVSEAGLLYKELKGLAFSHAYKNRSVLELELTGHNTIHDLMDKLWMAIIDTKDQNKLSSRRKSPYTRYIYGRISEGYRRVFENEDFNYLPQRYREVQLLTDMISGMTDNYLMQLNDEFKKYK